jgi:hypothetical protein
LVWAGKVRFIDYVLPADSTTHAAKIAPPARLGSLGRILYLQSVMDEKDILHRLARYYGGEYTEIWEDETNPGFTIFSATIRTPRTVFNYRQMKTDIEPDRYLEERVRYELVWSILQKGVEFVNEQSDIFKMFNPDV